MAREVDGARFRPDELPAGRVPVMFMADWCGYCRRYEPHHRKLTRAWIVDISDDDDPLWDALAIRVVPTVIMFEDGKPTRRWAGVLDATHAAEIAAALAGSGTDAS